MKYGFIIDNRKCIGFHACTVACKTKNYVPLAREPERGQVRRERRFPQHAPRISGHALQLRPEEAAFFISTKKA